MARGKRERESDPERGDGWRLTFDGSQEAPAMVIRISNADHAAADRAIDEFRARVRMAMRTGACRTFTVGVHVEGAACDHSTGGE